ncbi:cation channel family protein [Hyphomonas neptunium ATCC 15444]|uniref:Cation channel family protein n=2 Tax=Hyphomonas TaxID=85 RepID=Q0BXG6_HYPNA|nr:MULTISPECIES: ion transporter [Hyphomonas]ABI76994.1 cation channel family protein [Hyphomonas neptunium ATCC 15444]KCZ89936.1 cation channel family protein [Hyphomonas hirschiana VP5]
MPKATLDEKTYNSSAERFIERPFVRDTIMALIVINAVVLGVLTYSEQLPAWLVAALTFIDMAVTFIFVAEIVLKLYVYRLQFFKLGWNWFDFMVVGVSVIPGGSTFNVLRALRVLRLLRLLHFIPTMKRITEALLTALPGMGAILAILGLVFYVSVVMATYLFSGSQNTENFSTLAASALTMFEVLTMEGWNGHMRDLMEEYPWAWMFFIPFILFTVWAILNLFTAVIVDSLQDSALEKMLDAEEKISDELEEQETHEVIRHRELMALISELRAEVQELKQSRSGPG